MKKRNLVTLLLVVALLLSFGGFTFARYVTEVSGKGEVSVAKWAVKVTDGTDELSDSVKVPFTVTANANVVSGKVAPGSTAVGNLTIDPTGSEVAIDYSISIDASNLTDAGLAIKSVKVGDNALTSSNGAYTGSLSLTEVTDGTKVNVTIEVEWVNDEANNTKDTATGINAGTLEIPVNVVVKQHIA